MATAAPARPRVRRLVASARAQGPALAWLAPVAVFVLVRYGAAHGFGVEFMLGAIAVTALANWAFRKPASAVVLLLGALPFHALAMAFLYRIGIPAVMVRGVTYWKETVALGVMGAALRKWRREHHGFDWVDGAALAYVALGLVYVYLPSVVIEDVLNNTHARTLGFRDDVFYVLLLVAARHLRLTPDEVRRALRAFLIAAFVVAVVAWFEFFATETWINLVEWFQVKRYRLEVLDVDPRLVPVDYLRVVGSVGGREILRVGSVELNYLTTGFYLALGLIVGIDRFSRAESLRSLRSVISVSVIGFGVLLTQTRSAIVMAGIGVLFVARRDRWRPEHLRIRTVAAVAALLLIVMPIAAGAGLIARFGGDEVSDTAHEHSGDHGMKVLAKKPLGIGIGTGAGAGARTGGTPYLITESQYLQIATQLGILGLALWLAALGGAGIRLARVRSQLDDPDGALIASAMTTAVVAFAVGSYLHQTLIAVSTASAFCLLLGAGLGAAEREDDPAQQRGQPGGQDRRQRRAAPWDLTAR